MDGRDVVQETSPRTFISMAAAYEHGTTAFAALQNLEKPAVALKGRQRSPASRVGT
jgi:hypothetical protein